MKNILLNYKILILSLVIGMGACTDNFEEVNTNPNQPTVVPTSYLMTQAQRANVSWILEEGSIHEYGIHYSQMWSQTQYTSFITRYDNTELNFSTWYSGPLADIQEIINIMSDPDQAAAFEASGSTNNQLAVARIMRAWAFQNITDFWGDVPYSEALAGRENFQPKYDAQSAIYADLVKELKEAAAQIDGGLGMQGDIIFGGDMDAWKMFANSLLLRVGIRMSNVDPAAAQDAISSALAGGVFASNADNAIYTYLSDANNWNPWYNHFLTRTDYAISDVMVGYLKDVNDPRLPMFADPAPSPKDPNDVYVGMPYGVVEAIAGSITNDEISFPGAMVRESTSPGIMMTYSEVLFIQAEAAARGMIGGDAEALYEQAITASLEQWGVDAADIATYLGEAGVAYDGLKSIGYQKYYALYMTGLEAYSEFRRTGYPELTPAPDAIEDREIPRRMGYPQAEKDLNGDNVAAAISRMGGDDLSTKVWWDGGN